MCVYSNEANFQRRIYTGNFSQYNTVCAHSTVLDDNPPKRDFRKGVYIRTKGEITALLTLIASAIFGDTKKLYL